MLILIILIVFSVSLSSEILGYQAGTEREAVEFLVSSLMKNLQPIEAVVIGIQDDLIVLDKGQAHGVRDGLQFEIYQDDLYSALVEVVDIRSRNAFARFIDKRYPVEVGAYAEEVKGLVVVSSFLDSDTDLERQLSRSIQEQFINNLGRQSEYHVVERTRMEDTLQEQYLSYTGLLEKGAVSAGHLVVASAIVTGIYSRSGQFYSCHCPDDQIWSQDRSWLVQMKSGCLRPLQLLSNGYPLKRAFLILP